MATTKALPAIHAPVADPSALARRPSSLTRFAHWLFQPVDLGLIVFFRVAFGAIMLWEVYRYFSKGWIKSSFIDPAFHFTYYGFEWIRPWPGNGMYWHFAAMGVLAACIAAGLFYRAATVLFFLAWTYMFLLDQVKYLNHFYLICLVSFLMIFIPAHRAFSLDVLRRPSLFSATAPQWTLWLLRTQIGIAYFYGGLAKCNADWFAGEPMRLFLNSRYGFTADGRLEPVPEAVVWFFTWGGLLFDLLIVPALLWPRTRTIAFCTAVLFHFMNDQMFQIGIFPWFMVAATLIFCPPEWLQVGTGGREEPKPRRARGKPLGTPSPARLADGRLTTGQKTTLGLLGVYVVVQLLVPLRHYLYPGPVNWTEEGHHFAWHMKLRAKDGIAVFHAFDADGKEIPVPPTRELLSPRQIDSMPGKPYMVLQYAHHLADVLRGRGDEPAAVRADVFTSLNGREPQRLVDPDVNLLEKHRSLRPADWIVPLTTPLPPRGSLEMMERRLKDLRSRGPGPAPPGRPAPESPESVE